MFLCLLLLTMSYCLSVWGEVLFWSGSCSSSFSKVPSSPRWGTELQGPLDVSLPSLTVSGGHLKFYEVSKQECTCPYMFQAEFSSPLLEGGSICNKGSPGGSAVKNPPANAGDTADVGSIPGSGRRSLGEGNAAHSSILAWEIPWTEETGGLQPVELRSRTQQSMHAFRFFF